MPALLSLLVALTIAAPSPFLVRDLNDTPAASLRARAANATLEWDP
ncbi:MAG TPA: hypothetical protein VL049_05500 [Candidatus Dormibacteraeota bacterium]|nr:hypothetical protein [Candidatus Dormibacteraeota bacterium]